MPYASRAQSRLIHAAAANPAVAKATGFAQAAAQKFVADSHGQRVRDLPEHVPQRKAAGGAVRGPYPPPFRW